MNKFVLILLFFCSSFAGAQDNLAIANTEKTTAIPKNSIVDTASITNRTFAKNFKKKYTEAPYIYEFKTPEKNAWDRFKEWLASILKDVFRFSSTESSLHFIGIALKVIAALIVVFVIYLIAKAVLNKEVQWIFGRNSDKKNSSYSEIEKNLHRIDFEKLIHETLRSDQKRLSIRYYYLWLLQKMSASQIIIWDIEKTNSDYLYELKNQTQKEDFAYLSYLYNYIWYGEFELDEPTFEKAKNAFEKTIKSIKNE